MHVIVQARRASRTGVDPRANDGHGGLRVGAESRMVTTHRLGTLMAQAGGGGRSCAGTLRTHRSISLWT